MGDSRKYPYPLTDGFSEFRRHGGFFELEFRRYGGGGSLNWIPRAWGVSDLGFPEGTGKSVFLEKANFVDFTSS